MTTNRSFSEHEGDFSESTSLPDCTCRKCKKKGAVTHRDWESSCGGYVDHKYTCGACGHIWWVEGSDS